MRQVRIIAMNGWEVISYGNGLSYGITGPGGVDVFYQGDDAASFREEMEHYENAFPDMYYSEMLPRILGMK